MTIRWPGTVTTLTCLLLALPLSAHAECAWVLWQQLPPTDVRGWEPIGANATQALCIQHLTLRLQFLQAGNDPLRNLEMRCLPDTVDPRGPRNK